MNNNKSRGSILSLAVLLLLNEDARGVHGKHLSASLSKHNNDLIDMGSMGDKLSTLQLSMLNKNDRAQDSNIPNEQMIQIKRDDMNFQDIMQYSTINSEGGDDVDTPALSSGGAIMDALAESDPSIKKLNKSKTSSDK